MSPFNARSLYAAHLTLTAEPPASMLSAAASTYSDAMPPNIRSVTNGYFYPPPGTSDSRFSS